MRYADYYDCDICNGNSVGMSLFVTGCPFRCKDCFNSDIWDYDTGKEWTSIIEEKFIKLVGRDYIKRITFVGGSPLCDNNIKDVSLLIQRIKYEYPNKQIWVYTGYEWDEIINNNQTVFDQYRREILEYIDVLVDGRFNNEKKDLTLPFRGSRNQRIIDVQKSLKEEKIVLWTRSNL